MLHKDVFYVAQMNESYIKYYYDLDAFLWVRNVFMPL